MVSNLMEQLKGTEHTFEGSTKGNIVERIITTETGVSECDTLAAGRSS